MRDAAPIGHLVNAAAAQPASLKRDHLGNLRFRNSSETEKAWR
jgi:hypothetical protein